MFVAGIELFFGLVAGALLLIAGIVGFNFAGAGLRHLFRANTLTLTLVFGSLLAAIFALLVHLHH